MKNELLKGMPAGVSYRNGKFEVAGSFQTNAGNNELLRNINERCNSPECNSIEPLYPAGTIIENDQDDIIDYSQNIPSGAGEPLYPAGIEVK